MDLSPDPEAERAPAERVGPDELGPATARQTRDEPGDVLVDARGTIRTGMPVTATSGGRSHMYFQPRVDGPTAGIQPVSPENRTEETRSERRWSSMRAPTMDCVSSGKNFAG